MFYYDFMNVLRWTKPYTFRIRININLLIDSKDTEMLKSIPLHDLCVIKFILYYICNKTMKVQSEWYLIIERICMNVKINNTNTLIRFYA